MCHFWVVGAKLFVNPNSFLCHDEESIMTADVPMEHKQNSGITQEEVAVYDRQIRLWGLEAQNMLRSSEVLLIGLSPLGAEVTKNLMLCGLGGLTICDNKVVNEDDIASNFLLQDDSKINRATSSAAKAKVLNPMVNLQVREMGINDFDEDALKQYNLIILIDEPYETVKRIDEICRKNSIKFIAGGIYGWYGYAFFDFDQCKFLKRQNKFGFAVDEKEGGEPVATVVEEDIFEKEVFAYPSFEEAFNVDWHAKKYIRKAKRLVPPSYVYLRAILRAQQENICPSSEEMSKIFNEERQKVNQTEIIPDWNKEDAELCKAAQLSPVAAIVGGMIGQEAIKALSEARLPLHNIFIYSAPHTTGHILHYPPE